MSELSQEQSASQVQEPDEGKVPADPSSDQRSAEGGAPVASDGSAKPPVTSETGLPLESAEETSRDASKEGGPKKRRVLTVEFPDGHTKDLGEGWFVNGDTVQEGEDAEVVEGAGTEYDRDRLGLVPGEKHRVVKVYEYEVNPKEEEEERRATEEIVKEEAKKAAAVAGENTEKEAGDIASEPGSLPLSSSPISSESS